MTHPPKPSAVSKHLPHRLALPANATFCAAILIQLSFAGALCCSVANAYAEGDTGQPTGARSASAPDNPMLADDSQPAGILVETAAEWISSVAAAEPTVRSCVEAALEHFRGQEDSLRELLRRSRRSNWLPNSLRLAGVYRHVREDEWRYHVDQSFDESDIIDATDVEDRLLDQRNSYVEVRVQLEWRLSELRHSSDEVALRRLDRSRSDDSRELAKLVIELFFERRGEQLKYFDARRNESHYEVAQVLMIIDQQTAFLTELTGGWFAQQLHVGDARQAAHERIAISQEE